MLGRSSAVHGKICKVLQLVVDTMAMPLNISWSISWAKKWVGTSLPVFQTETLQVRDDQFTLLKTSTSHWSVQKAEAPTLFIYCFFLLFLTSNILRWLNPQLLPARKGRNLAPLARPQALIVIRTCMDGTFANDVALGCGLQCKLSIGKGPKELGKCWKMLEHVERTGIIDQW